MDHYISNENKELLIGCVCYCPLLSLRLLLYDGYFHVLQHFKVSIYLIDPFFGWKSQNQLHLNLLRGLCINESAASPSKKHNSPCDYNKIK